MLYGAYLILDPLVYSVVSMFSCSENVYSILKEIKISEGSEFCIPERICRRLFTVMK